jgi:hypothetical protein
VRGFLAVGAVLFLFTALAAGAELGSALSPESGSAETEPPSESALDVLIKNLVNEDVFDGKPYGLEKGNYVVARREKGILGTSGVVGRVRLIALRREDGIYDRALFLEITPGAPEVPPFLITLPSDVQGFDSKIEIKRFTALDRAEILLSLRSGRRGRERLLIIEAKEGGRVLYDSQTTKLPTIKGRFFDGYRAEVVAEGTSERLPIDLSNRKELYNKRLVYNESSGTLRSPVTVWGDRYEVFRPMDVDGDGLYELKGVLELYGVGRADRVAYVDATLKYAGGQWTVADCWLVPAEDLSRLPEPIRLR